MSNGADDGVPLFSIDASLRRRAQRGLVEKMRRCASSVTVRTAELSGTKRPKTPGRPSPKANAFKRLPMGCFLQPPLIPPAVGTPARRKAGSNAAKRERLGPLLSTSPRRLFWQRLVYQFPADDFFHLPLVAC